MGRSIGVIDPKLDAIVVKPGLCTGCGAELPQGAPVDYCPSCVAKAQALVGVDTKDLARRELAQRELCRRHLLPFIQRIKPDYKAGWFHKDLAARLERFVRRVERGESPRLLINVPPRRGKTEQASRALPAWVLGKHPDWSFIAVTHSNDLAMDNSRDVQEYLKDEKYRTVFPDTVLDPDNKGAAGWRTTKGGKYQPAGAGKGIAGRGAHIFLIDDPHKDKEAYSETVRASIWRWYKSSVRTRLAPGGGIILIQTRWVLDDLTGRLIDEEGLIQDGGVWEQVVYPEEAVHDEYRMPNGVVVDRPVPGAVLLRKKGECLHPERYPPESNIEHKRDPVTWAALYQQDPVAEGAGTVDQALLDHCACRLADVPSRLTYYSTWDTAVAQTEGSCNTAKVTGGVDAEGTLWIVDVEADRLDSLEVADRIIASYRQYREEATGIEKANHAVAVAPFLDKYLAEQQIYGINIVELVHGNKDKVARARPMQARMRQGKVKIPIDAPWYDALRSELLRFPAAPNDIADAFFYQGQLLDEMAEPFQPKPKPKKSWRDKLRPSRGRDWRRA